MKVLVTGGTGFIGAHTVAALCTAGHEVRLLLRDPSLVATCVEPLGGVVTDWLVGDVTDPTAVRAAIDGCEAVVHAAAAVALGAHDTEPLMRTNVDGARTVLDAALAAGCDPIVHVSSIAALHPPAGPTLHPDSPITEPTSPYGQSKAMAEHHARTLQAKGAPVVSTYPAMVLGPPAGPRPGEGAEAVVWAVRTGTVSLTPGAWSVVDVRDVAAALAAAVEPGRGPRRYMLGGHFLTPIDVADALDAATGRHLRRVPVPSVGVRLAGRIGDLAERFLPVHVPLSHETVEYLLAAVPCDSSTTTAELGVRFRPAVETFSATLAGLVGVGRISPEQAGQAAPSE